MNRVLQGDCLEVLRELPDNYFDSLITDPPAGIAFMGKKWDHHKGGMLEWINWLGEILTEANRTMKPGALGLVWSIPRTSHWTGMAIELAGFRIVDIVHSCQGSGFPKAQDIGKLIDNMAGAEREVIGFDDQKFKKMANSPPCKPSKGWNNNSMTAEGGCILTAPATDEAKQWDGWKTPALKPAVEGWWLIQKPITESSIARNILKHGVGGINIEACRIGMKDGDKKGEGGGGVHHGQVGRGIENKIYGTGFIRNGVDHSTGRYPANLVLSCGANCDGGDHSSDCPVTLFPETHGAGFAQDRQAKWINTKLSKDETFKNIGTSSACGHRFGDKGTAARFFKQLPFDSETTTSIYYQAKASKSDRSCGGVVPNVHPTVKSRHLIAYFLKLITPPGGVVLDCFGGSGTTAVASIENGFNYCLIEKESEYIEIINQRIAATQLPLFQAV